MKFSFVRVLQNRCQWRKLRRFLLITYDQQKNYNSQTPHDHLFRKTKQTGQSSFQAKHIYGKHLLSGYPKIVASGIKCADSFLSYDQKCNSNSQTLHDHLLQKASHTGQSSLQAKNGKIQTNEVFFCRGTTKSLPLE